MKRTLSLLLAATLLLALAGCSRKPSETLNIGILAAADSYGRDAAAVYYAEESCAELSDRFAYTVVYAKHAGDTSACLDELREWGADAVVVLPQWSGMEQALSECAASGIVIVTIGNYMAAEGAARIVIDDEYIGTECARYISGKTNRTGLVIMLETPNSNASAEPRKNAYLEAMAELAPSVTTYGFTTSLSRADAYNTMTEVMKVNPHIDGVFTAEDEVALGVLRAVQDAGRDDIGFVTGAGGAQELLAAMSGDISVASAVYLPKVYREAVSLAAEILDGKEEAAASRLVKAVLTDIENVDKYLDENAPY